MPRIFILFVLLFASSYTLLVGQDQKVLTATLKLAIYEGDAYKRWYAYSVDADEKIREKEAEANALEADSQGRKVRLAVVQKWRDQQAKADKAEARATIIHEIAFPISFVFTKSADAKRPYNATSVLSAPHDSIYEDDFFRVILTDVSIKDNTEQNCFGFELSITNKHVQDALSEAETFGVGYTFITRYSAGKLVPEDTQAVWGGHTYRSLHPRVYVKGANTYSFIPFFDRFREATLNIVETW